MGYNEKINLLNVYLTDLNFREESYWKQIFAYYYSTIIVLCFPVVASAFGAKEAVDRIPAWVFYIIGIGMALCFFYVSQAYIARTKPLIDVYNNIVRDFPQKYQRETISDSKNGRLYGHSMKTFVSIVMLISQLTLAVLLWIFL